MKVFLPLLFFSLHFLSGWSQVNIDSLCQLGVCTPQGFAIPSIDGMPRPKGLEIYQERIPSYQLTSNIESLDSSATEDIRSTKSWMVKLRAPVINKDNFKLIVGLQYYQQEFYFEEPDALTNAFHQSLEDKGIRSAGLSLNSVKSFIGNKYLVGRLTLRLNGDFETGDFRDHMKSSFSLLYGIKNHALRTWGFGVSYNNTLGRSSIYPILFLSYKFKPKWTFQALLPASAQLMYMANDKNIFSFNNKFEGDNYNLNFPTLQANPLYLEQADFKSFLSYEREIYDFLWLGISTGMRFNINFDVSDSDVFFDGIPLGNTNHVIISNDLTPSPFFRIGLFLVAPRKWME